MLTQGVGLVSAFSPEIFLTNWSKVIRSGSIRAAPTYGSDIRGMGYESEGEGGGGGGGGS